MSISKIAPSLLSVNQETNFGLATINLDFSLIQVKAPAEYEVLGKELSSKRRTSAEIGLSHITARKLGALFRHALPKTTHLVRKYGTRASEIASDPKVNPKPVAGIHGLFTDHVGIDGTNIWAAATSGSDAVAVHLLACMLARMWQPSEAVAIWAEMVAERKKLLSLTDETDPNHVHLIQESKIDVNRDQLAHWDSGARAWLKAADDAMAVKQTQLMLVLNNISLPISTKPALYHNVMEAWTSAMTAMDHLCQGMPQRVNSGSVLLGLSAWHLYPNMLVLFHSPDPILQNDHLVDSAGILTIGLNDERTENCGVSWSLPLGQLKYYGRPVVSETTLQTKGMSVTVTQLFPKLMYRHWLTLCMLTSWDSSEVAAGAMTRHWRLQESTLATFFQALWTVMSTTRETPLWLKHLVDATDPILHTGSIASKQAKQRLKLGSKRCRQFLVNDTPPSTSLPKAFGLLSVKTFISLYRRPEDCVQSLREYAESLPTSYQRRTMLIRYRRGVGDALKYQFRYEYATALPMQRISRKRLFDEEEKVVLHEPSHARWLDYLAETDNGALFYDETRIKDFQTAGEATFDMAEFCSQRHGSGIRWTAESKLLTTCGFDVPAQENDISMYFKSDGGGFEDVDLEGHGHGPEGDSIDFTVIAGDLETVALLILEPRMIKPDWQSNSKERTSETQQDLSVEIASRALTTHPDKISGVKMAKHFSNLVKVTGLKKSLGILSTLAAIYNNFPPSATVALEVAEHTLSELPFASMEDRGIATDDRGLRIDRATTFAYIAFFETGHLIIPPRDLDSVMAMALNDSILLASDLISDPSRRPKPWAVERIRGNIGKPGLALMIPPHEPLLRVPALDNWHLVNHDDFDSLLNDAFQKTTMHLSFTEYSMPLHVGNHGLRDKEVYFQETVVSVHDGGEWVADLDILGAMEQAGRRITIPRAETGAEEDTVAPRDETLFIAAVEDMDEGTKAAWFSCRLGFVEECTHVQRGGVGSSSDRDSKFELISIDDWNEILVAPETASIVRSFDNWIGRLATMVVCLQVGKSVIIAPDRLCFTCVEEQWREMGGEQQQGLDGAGHDSPTKIEDSGVVIIC